MERITDVTKDCFNAIAQLRRLEEGQLPPPEALHRHLRAFVDAMMKKGAQAGYSREDVDDIAYAVVALADEVALSKGEAMRSFWIGQQLQLAYFQENVAGEGFFTRLEAIRRDPRRSEVLQAYYLALLFGFQGRFRVRGGEMELLNIVADLQRQFSRRRKKDIETLSPSGERPDDSRAGASSGKLLAGIVAAVLLASLLTVVGLRVWVGSTASAVADRAANAKLN
jgi:type VI secretion system protein ImpK